MKLRDPYKLTISRDGYYQIVMESDASEPKAAASEFSSRWKELAGDYAQSQFSGGSAPIDVELSLGDQVVQRFRTSEKFLYLTLVHYSEGRPFTI